MNRSRRLPLLPAAGLFLAAALWLSSGRAANPPARAGVPSATIQQRIDALLKHRLKPEPLPVDPPNPFVVVTGSIRETASEAAGPKPAGTNENESGAVSAGANPPVDLANSSSAEVLAACAARLKIGGIIRMKDQIQIVINDVPRKEGDFIAADWNNAIVHLRVVRLLPSQLVLRLGDAEVMLRY